jgi:hypothetical protein
MIVVVLMVASQFVPPRIPEKVSVAFARVPPIAQVLVAAAALALIACAAPPETGRARIFYWDVAGLLALIGLAAALFGEPEQAVALLRREEA